MNTLKIKVTLYDVFLIFLAFLGLSNVFFLTLGAFKTQYSLILGVFLTITLILFFRLRISPISVRKTLQLLIILFFALLLRVPPWLYILGGQDQGTYINISKQYELGGRLYAIDHFRESLTPEQKVTYDKYGNYLMPSFEKWNRQDSEYTMKFYPIHPSFLANFSQIFGSTNRIYSLTLFSAVSLINVYLIVVAISKSRKAGLISVLLLAVNPLHVFFSKMPVGEITALAFSTGGIYFLTKFISTLTDDLTALSKSTLRNIIFSYPVYLYCSLLLFFVFMFTRMTFFIYVLLFYFILIGVLLFSKKVLLKVYFLSYFIVITAFLSISYLYYYKVMWPLYNLIFYSTFVKGLNRLISFYGSTISEKLAVLIALAVLGLCLTYFLSKLRYTKTKFFYDRWMSITIIFILALFVFTVFTSLRNYDTLAFKGLPDYERYNISLKGIDSLKNISLFSISNHISLFLFLLYISYFIYYFKNKNNIILFITFFSSSFFLILYSLNIKYMRYDYYNSRYYLTEVIPFFLIFISLYLDKLFTSNVRLIKYCAYTVFLLSLLSSFYFSLVISKWYEGVDLGYYRDVIQHFDNKDTIYVYIHNAEETKYSTNFNLYAFAPIKYYYNRNTIVLEHISNIDDPEVKQLLTRFKNIILLSNRSLGILGESAVVLNYYHYNNTIGCGYHNYEFLNISDIHEISLPDPFKCNSLPTTHYRRDRIYFIYNLTN